jgi:uncharacterized protein YyaL (SSP411 family)
LYFGDERYSRAGEGAVATASALAKRYPSGFGFLLSAAHYSLIGAKEIAITGETSELSRVVGTSYVPRRILITTPQSDLPLMHDRPADRTAAYVCEHYRCGVPATTPDELRAQL